MAALTTAPGKPMPMHHRMANPGNTCSERNVKGHSGSVTAIAFSPIPQTLASGDSNGSVKIWNLNDGTASTTLVDTGHPVVALDYARDGAMLAVLTRDPAVQLPFDSGAQTIKVWRTSDWSVLKTLDGRAVRSLKFAPDRRSLVAAPVVTGFASVWDTTSWNVRTINDPQAAGADVSDMSVSPNGRYMVTVGGGFQPVALELRWGADRLLS